MSSDLAVIDQQALDELRALGPEADGILGEMIDLFIAEARPDMDELREAGAAGARDDVARLAHRLKGMCGHLGASRVANACVELEHIVPTATPDELAMAVTTVGVELHAAEEALAELR